MNKLAKLPSDIQGFELTKPIKNSNTKPFQNYVKHAIEAEVLRPFFSRNKDGGLCYAPPLPSTEDSYQRKGTYKLPHSTSHTNTRSEKVWMDYESSKDEVGTGTLGFVSFVIKAGNGLYPHKSANRLPEKLVLDDKVALKDKAVFLLTQHQDVINQGELCYIEEVNVQYNVLKIQGKLKPLWVTPSELAFAHDADSFEYYKNYMSKFAKDTSAELKGVVSDAPWGFEQLTDKNVRVGSQVMLKNDDTSAHNAKFKNVPGVVRSVERNLVSVKFENGKTKEVFMKRFWVKSSTTAELADDVSCPEGYEQLTLGNARNGLRVKFKKDDAAKYYAHFRGRDGVIERVVNDCISVKFSDGGTVNVLPKRCWVEKEDVLVFQTHYQSIDDAKHLVGQQVESNVTIGLVEKGDKGVITKIYEGYSFDSCNCHVKFERLGVVAMKLSNLIQK